MSQTTANLALPLIAAAQAGKHVTYNEALAALDTLVQLACLDKDLTAPPPSPVEGARYLIAAAAPTGAWTGLSGRIVHFRDGVWEGFAPRAGWLAYVADEDAFYHFDGTGWTGLARTISALQNLGLLGLGTSADADNPFSAKLNKALWTARGSGEGGSGDLRTVLNKASAANVLSLLMQSGFSGRAEIGLVADDSLTAKVSADGTNWTHAWRVQPGNGYVGFGSAAAPGGPVASAPLFVSGSSNAALFQLECYSGTGSPVVNITTRIARGTPAAPTGILAGDRFFGFFGRGYQATGGFSSNMVTFNGVAEEDFTATAQGTLVDFQTTDIGTTTRRSVVKFRGTGALELVSRAGTPTLGLAPGQIVFDGTAGAFKGYNGTRWSRLTNLPRFSASMSADATIPAATWTKVAFNNADVNDQNAFVPATNRFVAPEPGTYTFGAGLAFRKIGSASPSALQARFYRNGAVAPRHRAGVTGLVDGISTLALTATLALNAGDTVEVFAHFTGAEGGILAADSAFWGLAVP
ncbi:DUF2793 domain-containing protein [Methylobacterium sp. 77]|uniref:DUF2793 domain-containing protein n=1 Tax=Methylobacterium sp. 77 TaxID=1101192 RepID=UPI00035FD3D5|nr:DUF2793 domain-containing protein [Methylobacterium sp. 77]